MLWLPSLTILAAVGLTHGEQCLCSDGKQLVCEKSVALTLTQPCVRQCVTFEKPEVQSQEEHPCTVREDIFSQSRPAYLVDIVYHPCYCVNASQMKPVCSTHFVTFINECAMNCIAKGAVKSHDGACSARSSELSCGSCLKKLHPLCGTDGKTYSNDCMFQCFKKENQIQEHSAIWAVVRTAELSNGKINRALTGHCPVNNHIENMGKVPDNSIRFYMEESETVKYCACPAISQKTLLTTSTWFLEPREVLEQAAARIAYETC